MHPGCFFQGENCAFHTPVIRIVKIPKHVPILLPRVNFQKSARRYKLWTPIFNETKEIAKGQPFVKMEQDMVYYIKRAPLVFVDNKVEEVTKISITTIYCFFQRDLILLHREEKWDLIRCSDFVIEQLYETTSPTGAESLGGKPVPSSPTPIGHSPRHVWQYLHS